METYEKRAKDRNAKTDKTEKKHKKSNELSDPTAEEKRPLIEVEDDAHKEEFVAAAKGAAGPHMSKRAFLKARQGKVDVDSKIGSVEIINPEAVATTKSVVGEGSPKVRIASFMCYFLL